MLTLKLLRPAASFQWPAPASYPTCLVLEVCKCSHTGTEETMHSRLIVANSTWQEYRIACRDQVTAQTILLPSDLPNNQQICDCPFLFTPSLLPQACYTPICLDFCIPLVWTVSLKHPIISCVQYSVPSPSTFLSASRILYPIMQSPLTCLVFLGKNLFPWPTSLLSFDVLEADHWLPFYWLDNSTLGCCSSDSYSLYVLVSLTTSHWIVFHKNTLT